MKDKQKNLSFWMTVALIVGTMIGSGIFLLPSSLAAFGPISLASWIFTAIGATFLAFTLSSLSKKIPQSGGPYTYTKAAFGGLISFLVGWGHWFALIIAGSAISVAFVGYLGVFFPVLSDTPLYAGLTALSLIWMLTFININSIKNTGQLQVLTTVLKILPLFLVILAGVLYFSPEYFTPLNVSDQSNFSAISTSATMTFFAFVGLESATIFAEKVKNPVKNVPRATILGVLAVAIIYIAGTTAVMGLLPNEELAKSSSPFADAASKIWGSWAGKIIGIGAIISCAGALNGIIFQQGQMSFVLARDGLFPTYFKKLTPQDTPALALITSSTLVTIFMAFNYTQGLVQLFTFSALLSTLAILLPLAFSALSELRLLHTQKGKMERGKFIRSSIIAFFALFYTIWGIVGAGLQAITWGLALYIFGLIIYFLSRFKRKEQ